MIIRHILLIALLSAAPFASAEHIVADDAEDRTIGGRSSLARFAEGRHSFQNQIDFPSSKGNVAVVVYCVVSVGVSGSVVGNHCFESANVDESFRSAVDTAIRSAKMIPAIVEGEARTVELYYRVLFVRQNDLSEIRVYSNWGYDVESYGLNYKAPQRYGSFRYPSACVNQGTGVTSIITINAKGYIEGDGDIRFEPEYPKGGYGHRNCLEKIAWILGHSKYIPGRKENEAVEATYVEAWGTSYRDMTVE